MIHNLIRAAHELIFNRKISNMNSNTVQGAIDELKGTIGYSRKNLLKNIKDVETKNEVTCTPNEDGSFTLTGKPTANTFFNINYVNNNVNGIGNGEYILNGSDVEGKVLLQMIVNSVEAGYDKNNQGFKFKINDTTNNWTRIYISNGTDLGSGITVYPMIRYASIEDDTYEPYVEDVQTQINANNIIRGFDIIEEIYNGKTTASSKEYFTYTAEKKCLLSVTFFAGHYEGTPQRVEVLKNGDFVSAMYNTSSHVSIPVTLILNKGVVINFKATYNKECYNQLRLNGFVQFLE